MSAPTTFRKLQAFEVGNDFNKVTKVVSVDYKDLIQNLKPNSVVVKNFYVGINASDINFTNGKYIPDIKPPFDVGFEALGEIVAVGSNVPKDKIGSHVIYTQYGAFAEYVEISHKAVIPVPNARPELLGLLTSGLTASIALAETGRMTKGETVLVTAAAGGAGQIAVQLAKLAGNHVIGTCSNDDKVAMLKEMGCDRVINYKKEDFKAVMKKEYPRGVDIIFESVGGNFFDICLKSLAVRGRLIVIGTVSTYADANGMAGDNVNTLKLLGTSRTVAGFFMPDYKEFSASHMANMIKLVKEGKLKVLIDNGGLSGIDSVAAGVAYLHSGKNKGKVVIPLIDGKSSKI
ncbi:zinc-binding alcohol dehydrogenase domain-containing protein 2-like isoform X2 [Mucor ambiguus]|uniref:Zinc-binding alcohol dehydrogenase domain-containing protein 2-like isoform X2 n=1 Tax=Mucor ambiguus TaxID=91626 RepID=A0A0C9LZW0_9FUNG|nr:zinc-binding alcohol dehydrogenase domain-containing protein 2-like isoform X2 [Mucor ambiguus]